MFTNVIKGREEMSHDTSHDTSHGMSHDKQCTHFTNLMIWRQICRSCWRSQTRDGWQRLQWPL